MNNDIEITLLSEEEIWGDKNGRWCDENGRGRLEVIRQYGSVAAITDLVILTGGYYDTSCAYMTPDDDISRGRAGWYWTRSSDGDGDVRGVHPAGSRGWGNRDRRDGTIRPALLSSSVFSQISPNRVRGYNGTYEVEYGEYPQYAPEEYMQEELESEYQNGNLRTTGRDYTFDSTRFDNYSQGFQPVKYEEYEYKGKKYIRVKANAYTNAFDLSNGESYKDGDYVWVEVSPVVWLIDDRTKTLVSKRGLLSGIRFTSKKGFLSRIISNGGYDGVFENTEMYRYLHKYMLRDLLQGTDVMEHVDSMSDDTYKALEDKIKELPEELQEEYRKALQDLQEELQSNNPKKR